MRSFDRRPVRVRVRVRRVRSQVTGQAVASDLFAASSLRRAKRKDVERIRLFVW